MNSPLKSLKTTPFQDFFPQYRDETRIWVYPLFRKMNYTQEIWVKSRLKEMMENWTAHNKLIPGSYSLYRSHFVIIANPSQVSGCGVDACFKVLAEINAYLGGISKGSDIYYLENDRVHSVPRYQLRSTISSGKVTPETLIINLQLTLLKELREGLLEVTAGQSIFSSYFKKQ